MFRNDWILLFVKCHYLLFVTIVIIILSNATNVSFRPKMNVSHSELLRHCTALLDSFDTGESSVDSHVNRYFDEEIVSVLIWVQIKNIEFFIWFFKVFFNDHKLLLRYHCHHVRIIKGLICTVQIKYQSFKTVFILKCFTNFCKSHACIANHKVY